MKTFITGDCHRDFKRFYEEFSYPAEPVKVIILGDAGINYYLDNRDDELKDAIAKNFPIRFYLVRGNHEARPESLPDIEEIYDDEVQGLVRYQPRWPQIRYLEDGWVYTIDGLRTLVIGGAYSVDKLFRLQVGYQWFADEQLSVDEQAKIYENVSFSPAFDLVLSHTCPLDWEPTDLFLPGINQATVDQSTEKWLQSLRDIMDWKIWLFGHFHADRIERPGVEMYFTDIAALDTIRHRWSSDEAIKEEWWLQKSPHYYT